ncbi:MAG: shikimate dehydrogenase [Pseudomonadota bacterium]
MGDHPRAFVIGHPIAHSRSPLIHGFWLKQMTIAGSYERVDLEPAALPRFINEVRAGHWIGGNVTIPHKTALMHLVDVITDDAARIGAANTLWVQDGKLHVTNTDAYGFAANMTDHAPQWSSASSSLVIGAGGASRAIIDACKNAGHENVTVVNRTAGKAEKLAEEFGAESMPLSTALENLQPFDVIINTSAAGMGDTPPLPIHFDTARPEAIAADIVYAPLETPFLRAAKQNGLQTVDGLGMLLHQAVPGFETWFGQAPKVDQALRQHILADLGEAL